MLDEEVVWCRKDLHLCFRKLEEFDASLGDLVVMAYMLRKVTEQCGLMDWTWLRELEYMLAMQPLKLNSNLVDL